MIARLSLDEKGVIAVGDVGGGPRALTLDRSSPRYDDLVLGPERSHLALLEGRVGVDELLNRWPEWDVDYDGIRLAPTSTVRGGWERMPIIIR